MFDYEKVNDSNNKNLCPRYNGSNLNLKTQIH